VVRATLIIKNCIELKNSEHGYTAFSKVMLVIRGHLPIARYIIIFCFCDKFGSETSAGKCSFEIKIDCVNF
jgi:hypothetical protein